MPVIATVTLGWPLAFEVIVICAVFAPTVVGVKVMVSAQPAPALMPAQVPAVTKLAASAPVSVMALTFRVAVPGLVMVSVCVPLLAMIWSPKAIEPGTLMPGVGSGVAVAASAINVGLPVALCTMLIWPVAAPTALAVKVIAIWH